MILNFAGLAFNIQFNYYSIMKETYSIITLPQTDNLKPDFQLSLFFRPGHYDLCYQKDWPNLSTNVLQNSIVNLTPKPSESNNNKSYL